MTPLKNKSLEYYRKRHNQKFEPESVNTNYFGF